MRQDYFIKPNYQQQSHPNQWAHQELPVSDRILTRIEKRPWVQNFIIENYPQWKNGHHYSLQNSE